MATLLGLMRITRQLCVLVLLCLSLSLLAADESIAPDIAGVTARATAVIGSQVDIVRFNAQLQLYVIVLKDGTELFSNPAVDSFVIGDLYAVNEHNQLANTSAQQRNILKVQTVTAIDDSQTVNFNPKGKPIGEIFVFTDVDCGFCRRLHQEVGKLLNAGIRVRYLAYPRSGLNTPSYQKMVNVWCAPDRQTAMTAAKQGKIITMRQCDNPVAEQYALGQKIGVRGTPLLILSTNQVIAGYTPAAELISFFTKS